MADKMVAIYHNMKDVDELTLTYLGSLNPNKTMDLIMDYFRKILTINIKLIKTLNR